MSETFVVEAVTSKFANKYNSGSVLTDGKWLQVSKKLSLNDFPKGAQVTVETKTNDKGYKSIVELLDDVTEASAPNEVLRTSKEKAGDDKVLETPKETKTLTYDENKSKRILVQGITQATIQSPSLAGLPFTNVDEAVNNIEKAATRLIKFVENY